MGNEQAQPTVRDLYHFLGAIMGDKEYADLPVMLRDEDWTGSENRDYVSLEFVLSELAGFLSEGSEFGV